jgi:hypothetical protein
VNRCPRAEEPGRLKTLFFECIMTANDQVWTPGQD